MKKVVSIDDVRGEKLKAEARDILADMTSATDEELDRRLQSFSERCDQHIEHLKGGTTMTELEKLYTPEEAAAYLHLSPYTVKDFLRKKTLHGIKTGKKWVIKESELKKFIDSRNGDK